MFFQIRFPRNENDAKKWKTAINFHYENVNIERGELTKGSICFEHFQESDFKRKNKSQLKSGSFPSIFNERNVENDQLDFHVAHPNNEIFEINDHKNCEGCRECIKKDNLIQKQKEKIECLRKSLKKAQNKAYYLVGTKKKLTATLSELKQQNLIDEKLLKAVQVKLIFSI